MHHTTQTPIILVATLNEIVLYCRLAIIEILMLRSHIVTTYVFFIPVVNVCPLYEDLMDRNAAAAGQHNPNPNRNIHRQEMWKEKRVIILS